jgi:hypothetical protein
MTVTDDRIDKAVTALRRHLGADDENFVCTDIDGAKHDLSPSGYYITSKPEGQHHRIDAGYWPDELAEEGFEACRERRGYDPIEFRVDEVEHARMVRDGVLDDVGGQSIVEALAERVEALAQGRDDN